MTNTQREWEGRLELLDVKLEELFQDAVRQCLRFITKEQTEQEMGVELASLNTHALKIIKVHFKKEIEAARAEGAAAERAKNNRVLYALALMWNQYCGERGHLYMTAGEAALEELQRAGLLGDNHEEIDYKKIDALLTPTNTV